VIVAGDPATTTLPRIEKFARKYDIRIAIHNHGPEDKLWPSPLDVLEGREARLIGIGCCIDVGTRRERERSGASDPGSWPRLFNVHIKDPASFTEKESQVAVGEGKMPVKRIFEALAAIKYQGFVDLEYEIFADEPMPGVIESLAYMRGVRAGMQA